MNNYKNCIHSITGSGKSKTVSLWGMVLRSYVYNSKIFVAEFLKDTGEFQNKIIKKMGDLVEIVSQNSNKLIYIDNITDEDKQKVTNLWNICKEKMLSNQYDMIGLDEILVVLDMKLITITEFNTFMKEFRKNNKHTEIILTGRMNRDELILKIKNLSQYFNKIKCYKHPSNEICVHCGSYLGESIEARKTIEY